MTLLSVIQKAQNKAHLERPAESLLIISPNNSSSRPYRFGTNLLPSRKIRNDLALVNELVHLTVQPFFRNAPRLPVTNRIIKTLFIK